MDQHIVLFKYNKLLSRRVRGWEYLYWSFILLFSILVGLGTILYMNEHIKGKDISGVSVVDVTYLALLTGVAGLTLSLARCASGTVLLPEYLILFPVSIKEIYKYQVSILLTDVQVLIYIFPVLILYVGFLRFGIITASLTASLFILYFFCINIWAINFYIIFSKLINKYKTSLLTLPFLLGLGINLLMRVFGYTIIGDVYVLNWIGLGVVHVLKGRILCGSIFLAGYILLFIVGYFCGVLLLKRKMS